MKQITISCEKPKYIYPRWKCIICKHKATSDDYYINMDWIDHERNRQGYKLVGMICKKCRSSIKKRAKQ